jgi:excisionase family DNA binding protein
MSIFDERFFTVAELANYLGVSPATVYAKLKDWPHKRPTPTDIRFHESDVRAILDLISVKPATPEPRRAPRVGTRANRRSGK